MIDSTPSQTADVDAAFTPYGEHYAENNYLGSFGGNLSIYPFFMDGYAATFRLYHYGQGRWISPDPAGLSAVDPTNPQTWNRYAYVAGNPLTRTDPSGLWQSPPESGPGSGGPSQGTPSQIANCGGVLQSDTDYAGIPQTVPCKPNATNNFPSAPQQPTGPSDVSNTWKKTVSCKASAQLVMYAVQSNMGSFADNRSLVFASNFPSQPIVQGGSYVIQPGLNSHEGGYEFPAGALAVTATSVSPTGWTFTPDPSHHYFDGTVAFSALNAGNGNITFAITANANFVNPVTKLFFGRIIKAGENSTWSNMLSNVQSYCKVGG